MKNHLTFNFELSSFCNSSCPSCFRTLYKKKTKLNEHLFYDDFENFILNSIDYIKSKYSICKFCGELGEPIMNPDIDKFLMSSSIIFDQVIVFTNGGLRKPSWFEQQMKEFKNLTFVFSIDGLDHKTNNIYRKNVNTNLAFLNLKKCMEIDRERIEWHFNIFEHNYEQAYGVIDFCKTNEIKLLMRKNNRNFGLLVDNTKIFDIHQYFNKNKPTLKSYFYDPL